MNCIKVISLYALLLINGCKEDDSQPKTNWYKAQVNSLYEYSDGNYVVGLGISARAFYLYKDEKNYKKLLKALKDSYQMKNTIEVGYIIYDNTKNRIVQVRD